MDDMAGVAVECASRDALIESIIELNYGDGQTDFSDCDDGCGESCGCRD